MDKVTDQNYKNMYFPAEIATITSVKQFDIDLPNRKPGIFFFLLCVTMVTLKTFER